MKSGLIAAIALFLFMNSSAQVQKASPAGNDLLHSDSLITMAAGKQFRASGWKKWIWGEHYRQEWATAVAFPVFRLDTAKGGLTPLKQGGGHQTKTLRLLGRDGKEYVLRTIDKSLDVLVPDEFKGTFINDLVNDQISTAHPYGPLAIARLAEGLSVLHTNPIIVFVPDAPELEEFRPVFANKLCLFEERPSGKGWEHTPFTHNAEDIINTEKLLEKVTTNTKNKVDQASLLKVRFLDMLVNDWDRHEDQWIWAEYPNDKGSVYKAFARDRDQSFSKTDGVALYFLSRRWALRPLQSMDRKIKDVPGSNYSARNLDRQFLNELKKEDWEKTIAEVQQELTDSVIRESIHAMPDPVNKISGEFLIQRVMARRDNLSGYGMKYYKILSRQVAVVGSEKKEQFIIHAIDGNSVSVTGLRENSDTFYHRVFYRQETKEINIYGLGGADRFTFSGEARNPFIIRLIGGEGNDHYTNEKQSGAGRKIRVYDSIGAKEKPGRFARINQKDDSLFHYNRASTRYDWYVPLIIPGYNPDDGFAIGLGILYKKQQWGKTPFGWQQRFSIDYATGTGAVGFKYHGLFRERFGKWDFDAIAYYKGPRYILNYYGPGNNTDLQTKTKSYYRIRSKSLLLNPAASRSWQKTSFRIGPFFETVDILSNDNRFIGTPNAHIDSSVYGVKYFGGIKAEWSFSTIRSPRYPRKGVTINAGATYLDNFSNSTSLLRLYSDISLYYTVLKNLTLAHRTGAATNAGDYEFYQSSTLGGSETLRGYWRTRFAGRTSFFQNTEARLRLAALRGYVFRGQLGLFAFFDDGRVWVAHENSSVLHTGYGGGIYFLPFNALALTFYYAYSKETSLVALRAGFFF